MANTLIVIAGPTAIGKTDLAIQVAKAFGSEIISADSRQFYREMNIGTARPSAAELSAVPHHFIGSHSVEGRFTVGGFEKEALNTLDHLFTGNPVQVMVGGSGLFIQAVTEGLDDLPKAGPGIREALKELFESRGISALQQKLQEADPAYYARVDLQNPQRLIRALEVCETTGKPFSAFHGYAKPERSFRTIKIGLNTDREELYRRINTRVDRMMEAGLLNEVAGLRNKKHLNALNTVGYSELFDHFEGKLTLDEAVDTIKQNTRRFAKRQLTWFRKDPQIYWFEPGEEQEVISYIRSQLKE